MTRSPKPRASKAGDGLTAAARGLSRTILDAGVQDILSDFRRLNTDEARGSFADHFLTRSAGAMERMWPVFYEMLKAVEERQLYANADYTTNHRSYASFQEYFEDRVGRPFEKWIELEKTHNFVHRYRPELFGEPLDKATRARLVDQQDREQQEGSRPGARTDLGNNIPKVRAGRPEGTSAAKTLRRLRKDRPDLHARVLDGELSAHAAAVEAGFRRRTATVPIEDPDRIAATLRRHLDPAALARLRDLLA